MAHHHRIAAIALTLALAAGVPAAAAAQQPGPGSPATASPCSEVCSNHHLHRHAPQNGRSEEKHAAGQPV
jgi:hypothetical protein